MNRKEELMSILKNVDEDKKILIKQTVEEILFLENQLIELKKYPFIKFHATDPYKQKVTIAGKQYKELSQAYMNAIRVLNSIISKDIVNEQDEFDSWIKEKKEQL